MYVTMVKGTVAVRIHTSDVNTHVQMGYHKGTFAEVRQNKFEQYKKDHPIRTFLSKYI